MLSYRIEPIPIRVSSYRSIPHCDEYGISRPSSIDSRMNTTATSIETMEFRTIVQIFVNRNAVVVSELFKFNYAVVYILFRKCHDSLHLSVSCATSMPHCPQGLAC